MDISGPSSTKYWTGHWTNVWQDTAPLLAGSTYCAVVHVYGTRGE
ncbi:hypothetical protein [Arthrobacter sp. efr-133-TYG-118]|nr:hypothetical protein [Arthrobacter sp. efr-133-TYG-118]